MYGLEEFRAETGVSRETCTRLAAYGALLERWQARINLVSRATLSDLWRRHFLDSIQLTELVPTGARRLVDVGSGAGFPGMVLAIAGLSGVTLVESHARRCAFLREVARETGTDVAVVNGRIEDAAVYRALTASGAPDVIVARGCANLSRLLHLVFDLLDNHTCCIFPKGKAYRAELEAARRDWSFEIECHPSASNDDGTILRLHHVARAHETA